jgi:general stress protein 26
MALSFAERGRFLSEPHIGALSVVEGDRAPLIVPIWYSYTPGGELWVHTSPESRKARAIHSAGRFSLMVQRTEPTLRYVAVEGPVTRAVPASRQDSWEMASRYLPFDKVAGFLTAEEARSGQPIAIYMRPEHWVSADLGAL